MAVRRGPRVSADPLALPDLAAIRAARERIRRQRARHGECLLVEVLGGFVRDDGDALGRHVERPILERELVGDWALREANRGRFRHVPSC